MEKAIQKTKYYNFYFFQISENILFTYLYLIVSILMNIINRVLYQKYNFKFNFTLLFLQQLSCTIFFSILSRTLPKFKEKVGEISVRDFLKNFKEYFFFCCLFILNYLSSFIGNQRVNTAMFVTLRKFLTVMNYLYDLLINKKQLPNYFSASVILILIGSILTGVQDFTSGSNLYLVGYSIVFLNNALSVGYAQFSDKFNKKHGYSNVKLLVYNSYLATPILFSLIIITGEYENLLKFDKFSLGFIITLFTSCIFTLILNSTYFISNEQNSSLFTQLFSNCKDVFISSIGWFILGDFKATFTAVLGILFSTSGALLFSIKSMIQNMKRNK